MEPSTTEAGGTDWRRARRAGIIAIAGSSLVAGAISALVAYSVSREVGVDKPKAINLGIVMGLLSTVGQIAGVWLHNKLVDLQIVSKTV